MTDIEQRLKEYAQTTEASFYADAPEVSARAIDRSKRASSMWNSFSKVAAVLVMSTIGLTTLGMVTNAAVPGDFLYPADTSMERTLAWFGLSSADQRLMERTEEAQALIVRDEPHLALETLADAVETELPQMTTEEAERHLLPMLQTADGAATALDDQGEVPGLLARLLESLGHTDLDTEPSGQTGGLFDPLNSDK